MTVKNSEISQKSEGKNPQDAIESDTGKYKDAVTDNTDTMSKLLQSSLPQGADPSPFKIGPLGGGSES